MWLSPQGLLSIFRPFCLWLTKGKRIQNITWNRIIIRNFGPAKPWLRMPDHLFCVECASKYVALCDHEKSGLAKTCHWVCCFAQPLEWFCRLRFEGSRTKDMTQQLLLQRLQSSWASFDRQHVSYAANQVFQLNMFTSRATGKISRRTNNDMPLTGTQKLLLQGLCPSSC